MTIPPRPWRVREHLLGARVDIYGSDGFAAAREVDPDNASLIVHLVNAEPAIVAALEAAQFVLDPQKEEHALRLVNAALAKVRP